MGQPEIDMGLSVSLACVTRGGARPRGRLVLPRPLGRAPPRVTQARLTLRSDVWSLHCLFVTFVTLLMFGRLLEMK